jgi:glucose-1-phosphate cytidylyltransferase
VSHTHAKSKHKTRFSVDELIDGLAGDVEMKTVLLAGGLGTRLAEETEVRPKPMVEIGGQPILWHIMKYYSSYGFEEFFIALGYKSEVIKRYFMDYSDLAGSLSIDLKSGKIEATEQRCENWVVHLRDTGLHTNTGGRLKRLEASLVKSTFMVTYGDGLSNIDLAELLRFHQHHGRIATVAAVRPPARFGSLIFEGDLVAQFVEKPQVGEGWINGGFLVFEPEVFQYIEGDQSSLEIDVLERLANERQLAAFRHNGFWQCMDTLRDKRLLENMWQQGTSPWKRCA